MNKIAVLSGKGGVGKTTLSVCIAKELKKRNYKVGLFDLDISGPTLDVALGVSDKVKIDPKEIVYYPVLHEDMFVMGLGLIIERDKLLLWNGDQRLNAVRELWNRTKWNDINYLVIDMPPSSAEELKVLLLEIRPDVVVLLTTPSKLAYADYVRVSRLLKFFGIKYISVVNMAYSEDPSKLLFEQTLPSEENILLPFDPSRAIKYELDVSNIVDKILGEQK